MRASRRIMTGVNDLSIAFASPFLTWRWRRVRAAAAVLALVVAGAFTTPTTSAQGTGNSGAAASRRQAVPRTPDGRPDLQGVWNFGSATPLERPESLAGKDRLSATEAEAFEKQVIEGRNSDIRPNKGTDADVQRAYNDFWWDFGRKLASNRTSLITDPPDGRLPSQTPAGRERYDTYGGFSGRNGTDSWLDRSLWERCVSYGGLPRMPGGYNNTLQIMQTPDHVAILYEMIHEVRIIPLDGRPHLSPGIRQLLGDSRGRWEGDTLVVHVTNFTAKTNFRGSADGLHLIERFKRVDKDTIEYEFTVDDPTTFTKSWTASFPFVKTSDKLFEYACHEGNRGLAGILAGARAKEKASATGAGGRAK